MQLLCPLCQARLAVDEICRPAGEVPDLLRHVPLSGPARCPASTLGPACASIAAARSARTAGHVQSERTFAAAGSCTFSPSATRRRRHHA